MNVPPDNLPPPSTEQATTLPANGGRG